MGARRGLRALLPLLVCTVAATAAGCGGSDDGGGESLEVEKEWHDKIGAAIDAKPEECRAGVGSACETHVAAVHAVTEQVREAVEARPDKDRYRATLDGATTIDGYYEDYSGRMCSTVPETTVDAATTELFSACSGLYTTIITSATDLQQNLRPAEESAAP